MTEGAGGRRPDRQVRAMSTQSGGPRFNSGCPHRFFGCRSARMMGHGVPWFRWRAWRCHADVGFAGLGMSFMTQCNGYCYCMPKPLQSAGLPKTAAGLAAGTSASTLPREHDQQDAHATTAACSWNALSPGAGPDLVSAPKTHSQTTG